MEEELGDISIEINSGTSPSVALTRKTYHVNTVSDRKVCPMPPFAEVISSIRKFDNFIASLSKSSYDNAARRPEAYLLNEKQKMATIETEPAKVADAHKHNKKGIDVKNAIENDRMRSSDIDNIYLIGLSSKMTKVKEILTSMSPSSTLNDEAKKTLNEKLTRQKVSEIIQTCKNDISYGVQKNHHFDDNLIFCREMETTAPEVSRMTRFELLLQELKKKFEQFQRSISESTNMMTGKIENSHYKRYHRNIKLCDTRTMYKQNYYPGFKKMSQLILFMMMVNPAIANTRTLKPTIHGIDPGCEYWNETTNECIACEDFYAKIPNSNTKMCLQKCFPDQYWFYVKYRKECTDCNQACLGGCGGNKSIIAKDGCRKCKYGVLENGEKTCLPYKEGAKFTCKDGYFLSDVYEDEAKWTENICRPCNNQCKTCISNGTHPIVDNCTCKIYQVIDYRYNVPEKCDSSCPKDFKRPNLTSSKLCIRCFDDSDIIDPSTNICKPRDFDYLFWSLLIALILLLAVLLCVCMCLAIFKREIFNRICCFFKVLNISQRQDQETYMDRVQVIKSKNVQPKVNYEPQVSQISCQSYSSTSPLLSKDSTSSSSKKFSQYDTAYIAEKNLKFKEDSDHLIGLGFFGPVYKGLLHRGAQIIEVAIKVISKDESLKETVLECVLTRTQLPVHLHIHQIIGVSMTTTDKPMNIVSPLRRGNLMDYLKRFTPKSLNKNLYSYCAQIADGMSFLSQYGIHHKNLRTKSILVKDEGHVEISNFGWSHNMDKSILIKKNKWRWLPLECLEVDVVFSQKTDIWSFGVTCWEIFTYCANLPYENFVKNSKELKFFLQAEKRLEKPSLCDEETFDIIKKCWSTNPEERQDFNRLYGYFMDKTLPVGRLDLPDDYVHVHTIDSPTTPNKAPPLPIKKYKELKKSPEYINFADPKKVNNN